jgi:hypothetical protein
MSLDIRKSAGKITAQMIKVSHQGWCCAPAKDQAAPDRLILDWHHVENPCPVN